MKSKMNIKSIIIMSAITVISMFFINMSFAANTGKVVVETANLRESANANSKILELISLNEEVEIIEQESGWYKVKYKGIKGYLREDLVTINGDTSNITGNQVDKNTNEDVNSDTNSESNVVEDNIEEATSSSEQVPEQNTPSEQKQVENQNDDTEQKENQLGKNKILEDTNLKIIPTINATKIVEVKKDEKVNATEIINGWICVETSDAKGWIRKEKLEKVEDTENQEKQPEQQLEQPGPSEQQPEEVPDDPEKPVETPKEVTKKYINSASVNLRKEANTSCEVLASLILNKEVEIISENNGWSKVKVDGMEGYVSTSLLSSTKQETSRGAEEVRKPNETTSTETNSNEQISNSNTTTSNTTTKASASGILATANQYLGAKYVYGGSSPSGFDCSGFTSYVYKQHGITLSRTAAGQYSNGVSVNKSELQQGDLVMFGKSGINHVGIYIGGGQIIHAANPSRGVTTDTINAGYYCTNYVGARRVL